MKSQDAPVAADDLSYKNMSSLSTVDKNFFALLVYFLMTQTTIFSWLKNKSK